MIKTYVISLPDSHGRQASMVSRLARSRLPFVFQAALDARSMTPQGRKELVDANVLGASFVGVNGSIGCALSHMSVYERFLEEGGELALVLEDDVLLHENLADVLRAASLTIRDGEIVLLYYLSPYLRGSMRRIHLSSVNQEPLGFGFGLYYPMRPNLHCAAAYLITPSAARGILRANRPLTYAADVWSRFYAKGAFNSLRVVHPYPASEEGGPSERTAHSGVDPILGGRWGKTWLDARWRRLRRLLQTSVSVSELPSPLDPMFDQSLFLRGSDVTATGGRTERD